MYERTPAIGASTSTVWFNRLGQVVRVDGWVFDDGAGIVPAAYSFAYDADGRLIEEHTKVEDLHWVYAQDQITRTSTLGGPWIYTLADGRAVHLEGPEDRPVEDRWILDYTYDSAARYTSNSGVGFYDAGQGVMKYAFGAQYTYDAQGRVATAHAMNSGTMSNYSFTYTESAGRLVIDVSGTSFGAQRWTYDFDTSHRVIRLEMGLGFGSQVNTYSYQDGQIDQVTTGQSSFTVRATGSCPIPTVTTAPPPPLPIQWGANYISLSNESVFSFNNLH